MCWQIKLVFITLILLVQFILVFLYITSHCDKPILSSANDKDPACRSDKILFTVLTNKFCYNGESATNIFGEKCETRWSLERGKVKITIDPCMNRDDPKSKTNTEIVSASKVLKTRATLHFLVWKIYGPDNLFFVWFSVSCITYSMSLAKVWTVRNSIF